MEYTFNDGKVATLKKPKFGDLMKAQKAGGSEMELMLNLISSSIEIKDTQNARAYIEDLELDEAVEFMKVASFFITPSTTQPQAVSM